MKRATQKLDMGIDYWPTGASSFLLPTCCTHGFVDAAIAPQGLKWKQQEKAVEMNKWMHAFFFTPCQLVHSFISDFFHLFIVKTFPLAVLDMFENRGEQVICYTKPPGGDKHYLGPISTTSSQTPVNSYHSITLKGNSS